MTLATKSPVFRTETSKQKDISSKQMSDIKLKDKVSLNGEGQKSPSRS